MSRDRITRYQMLMDMAGVVAQRSTCSRHQVGAIISRDSRVLSTGYNGAPAGMAHCVHTDPRVPCVDAVHAEANAIAFAARHGIATLGAVLHTTLMPCLKCSQLIINSGIVGVSYMETYRDQSGMDLMVAAGIQCVAYDELNQMLRTTMGE